MNPSNAPKSRIKTAVRVFRIIETVRELEGATLTELSRAVDIPKSTLHAYLSTLEELEYVDRVDEEYDLSVKYLDLGVYARNRFEVLSESEQVLNQLAKDSREVAWLSIETRGKVVFIAAERDTQSIRMDAHLGKYAYMHCSAAGKAILSALPEHRVQEIIDQHGLPARTEYTITDVDELLAELDRVRERGYAISDQEMTEGIYAISAPIVVEGEVLGSITVAGPANRINWSAREEEIVRLVRGASDEIALNIRYT